MDHFFGSSPVRPSTAPSRYRVERADHQHAGRRAACSAKEARSPTTQSRSVRANTKITPSVGVSDSALLNASILMGS